MDGTCIKLIRYALGMKLEEQLSHGFYFFIFSFIYLFTLQYCIGFATH